MGTPGGLPRAGAGCWVGCSCRLAGVCCSPAKGFGCNSRCAGDASPGTTPPSCSPSPTLAMALRPCSGAACWTRRAWSCLRARATCWIPTPWRPCRRALPGLAWLPAAGWLGGGASDLLQCTQPAAAELQGQIGQRAWWEPRIFQASAQSSRRLDGRSTSALAALLNSAAASLHPAAPQKQRQLLEWQAARSAGDEAGTLAAAASLERQDSAGSGNEPMEVRWVHSGSWRCDRWHFNSQRCGAAGRPHAALPSGCMARAPQPRLLCMHPRPPRPAVQQRQAAAQGRAG